MAGVSNNQEDWKAYFLFLHKLANCLAELAELEREKITAINQGELDIIDEIMREEQVHSMNLKGMEQRRKRMLDVLGVPPGKLDELPQYIPSALFSEGKRAIDVVKVKFAMYQEAAEIARENLEAGLRQLESISGTQNLGVDVQEVRRQRAMEKEKNRRMGNPVVSSLELRTQGMRAASLTYGQEEGKVTSPVSQVRSEEESEPVPTTAQQREAEGNSRMSDYIRRKKEAATGGEPSVKPTASLPPRSVMDSLRKQFAQAREENASGMSANTTGHTPLDLRGELLKTVQEEDHSGHMSGSSAVNLRAQLMKQSGDTGAHAALRKQAENQRGKG